MERRAVPPPFVSCRPEDLKAGQVIFFARPSLLQSWGEFFGHEWRHAGVLIDTDEGLRVASYGPKVGFRLDAPEGPLVSSSRIGVASVLTTEAEVARLQQFCEKFMDLDDTPYPLSPALVGPILHLGRTTKNPLVAWGLLRLVDRYCRRQYQRYGDRAAYVCSTFTVSAIRAARSEPLRIPMSAHPDDEVAYATPENQRDVAFARWLCPPMELWNAVSASSRADLVLPSLPLDDVDATAAATVPRRAVFRRARAACANRRGIRKRQRLLESRIQHQLPSAPELEHRDGAVTAPSTSGEVGAAVRMTVDRVAFSLALLGMVARKISLPQ